MLTYIINNSQVEIFIYKEFIKILNFIENSILYKFTYQNMYKFEKKKIR